METVSITAPATESAKQWQGWGTALKPAHEPMVLARKPVIGTIANNVLNFGVGGLNIDGSRVGSEGGGTNCANRDEDGVCKGHDNAGRSTSGQTIHAQDSEGGRFPANFIHDGLETEWAKFFYCAKTSKRDRNEGLDGFEEVRVHDGRAEGKVGGNNPRNRTNAAKLNHHPTVKPTSLMQYLVRLVTPPKGIVLDPFMGSGSTGKACAYEGFDFIGIDQSDEYVEIARARIEFAVKDIDADI
jgi:site-specific DNA-methyltransferase (adenine-specific)